MLELKHNQYVNELMIVKQFDSLRVIEDNGNIPR